MKTNLQIGIEHQRWVYGFLPESPLLQLVKLHGLSIQQLADIFEVSKSYMFNVLRIRTHPDMMLAFKMARYFEVTMEELFGYIFDDTGDRRPLLVILPGTGKLCRLDSKVKSHGAMNMVKQVANALREKRNIVEVRVEQEAVESEVAASEREIL